MIKQFWKLEAKGVTINLINPRKLKPILAMGRVRKQFRTPNGLGISFRASGVSEVGLQGRRITEILFKKHSEPTMPCT